MISRLRGTVESIAGSTITLDVHGVGYELFCSNRCLASLENGAQARIEVFTDVREDHIRLYGFADQTERQVFSLLIQVQGIGCRTAADIVSRIDVCDLLRSIGAGDIDRLQTVKGVGKKTAQRLVVELKDKVAAFADEQPSPSVPDVSGRPEISEAVQALQALGFVRKDAERAVQAAMQHSPLPGASAGEIVREALRFV